MFAGSDGSGKGTWQAIVYDVFFKPVVANDNILNVITFPFTLYLSISLASGAALW